MPKLWNILLTVFLLALAYVATVALTYDGYCYGFSDGKSPCSFGEHFDATFGWWSLLLIVYFPHVFIVGAAIFYANDVVYRFVIRTRTRRWLEMAGEDWK